MMSNGGLKVFMAVICILGLAVTQAWAARICTMQNAGVDKGKIKTYNGKIIKEFDEASTPAMQGNPCVELWCREQCNQESKCKKWAYFAVRGGKTTCTLYTNAKSKKMACPGNVCASEYGSCRGSY